MFIRHTLTVVLVGLSVCLIAGVSADQQSIRFSSGDRQVAFVELFTSEGCSSCPPADRWLRGLKNQPDLWTKVVPVAFHVDYWDYIGWQDRYAKRKFSDRHRRYFKEAGYTVYTPGMFKDGKEWRGWRFGSSVNSTGGNVGDLVIQLTNDEIAASFDAVDSDRRKLVLNVALLGMNLQSQVNAGENNGKTLQHDFVVLNHVTTSLKKDGDQYSGKLRLRGLRENTQDKALVAWVSSARRQAAIQATGGFIDRQSR